MIKKVIGIFAFISVFLACSAVAQNNAAAGKVKFATCEGCHSIEKYSNAYPTYRVPKLGGQHAEYITAALQAYRAGDRQHPTMLANAANLSDDDISDIAAYVSDTEKFAGSKNQIVSQAAVQRGKEKSAVCAACHAVNGVSELPANPILAGQHPDYIAQALKQYKEGSRNNAIMAGFAAGLSEQDMDDLGAYFGSQDYLQPVIEK